MKFPWVDPCKAPMIARTHWSSSNSQQTSKGDQAVTVQFFWQISHLAEEESRDFPRPMVRGRANLKLEPKMPPQGFLQTSNSCSTTPLLLNIEWANCGLKLFITGNSKRAFAQQWEFQLFAQAQNTGPQRWASLGKLQGPRSQVLFSSTPVWIWIEWCFLLSFSLLFLF